MTPENLARLKAAAAAAAGLAMAAIGSLPIAIQVLAGLMLLDFLSGVLAAFATGRLDSSTGGRGVAKKGLVAVLVTAGWLVGRQMPGDLPLAEVIAGFYAAVEVLSMIENLGRAGVPVPKFLRDAMVKLRDQLDAGPSPAGPSAAQG